MCIAVPGEVLEVRGDVADVDFDGARKELRLDLIEDVEPGEWVLNHVGYAIKKIDEKEARETLELFEGLV